jgi:hypothetical protein
LIAPCAPFAALAPVLNTFVASADAFDALRLRRREVRLD